MKGKIIIAIVIVLGVVSGLAGVKTLQIQKMIAAGKAFAPPPESVPIAVAREEKWQVSLTAIGSITAVQGVTVTAELPGTVREIAFEYPGRSSRRTTRRAAWPCQSWPLKPDAMAESRNECNEPVSSIAVS